MALLSRKMQIAHIVTTTMLALQSHFLKPIFIRTKVFTRNKIVVR